MRRPAALVFAATLALGVGLVTAHVSASADDQAAADAAMAAFSERMIEAGGVSRGPTDITELDAEELAEQDNFGVECFGDAVSGLEAGGRMEGETARVFSAEFTFVPPGTPVTTDWLGIDLSEHDVVTASIVTVDADHIAAIEELVDQMGSDDGAQCVMDTFVAQLSSEDTTGDSATLPGFELEASAEFDIGVGDASAEIHFGLTSEIGEQTYEFNTALYVARIDRSLVFVAVVTGAELVSEIDGQAELAALVDSL